MTIHVFPWGTAGDFWAHHLDLLSFSRCRWWKLPGKKWQRQGGFCRESKFNIFLQFMHNVAANLLFEKSLGLQNHILSYVKKQRGAEMRFFFPVPVKFCCLSWSLQLCSTRDVLCPVQGWGRCAEVALGDLVVLCSFLSLKTLEIFSSPDDSVVLWITGPREGGAAHSNQCCRLWWTQTAWCFFSYRLNFDNQPPHLCRLAAAFPGLIRSLPLSQS